jgi:hypothetical protein
VSNTDIVNDLCKYRHTTLYYIDKRLINDRPDLSSERAPPNDKTVSQSQSQSYSTTDSQSVSMSWCRAQSGTFDQRDFFFVLEVTVLSFGGALSDERSGLSFVSNFKKIYIYSYISLVKSPRLGSTPRLTDCQL